MLPKQEYYRKFLRWPVLCAWQEQGSIFPSTQQTKKPYLPTDMDAGRINLTTRCNTDDLTTVSESYYTCVLTFGVWKVNSVHFARNQSLQIRIAAKFALFLICLAAINPSAMVVFGNQASTAVHGSDCVVQLDPKEDLDADHLRKRPSCLRCARPLPICVCKALPSEKIELKTKVRVFI